MSQKRGRPGLTSSGIPPFSFSWELGGPIASLLGTGVALLMAGFLNAGFFTAEVDFGFVMALAELPVPLTFNPAFDGVGVGVPFAGEDFVKKLFIVR